MVYHIWRFDVQFERTLVIKIEGHRVKVIQYSGKSSLSERFHLFICLSAFFVNSLEVAILKISSRNIHTTRAVIKGRTDLILECEGQRSRSRSPKRSKTHFGHNFWTRRRREVRLGSKCSGTNDKNYKIIKVKVSWKKSPTAKGQISRSKVKNFKMVQFQQTCFVLSRISPGMP